MPRPIGGVLLWGNTGGTDQPVPRRRAFLASRWHSTEQKRATALLVTATGPPQCAQVLPRFASIRAALASRPASSFLHLSPGQNMRDTREFSGNGFPQLLQHLPRFASRRASASSASSESTLHRLQQYF